MTDSALQNREYESASRWQKTDWLVLLAITVIALLCFLPGLGAFGILDPSDGYYSEGAREMVESGDFLTPHLNYEPFFDKPILNYWMIAACYKLFGVSEWVSRLPAALGAAKLSVLMYVFARQFLRRRAAIFASLALLSSPMWLTTGHMSLTDMPLSYFVWIALGSFFLAIEKKIRWCAWVGYLALSLGLLTKGPLAGFLVAANLFVYLLITRRKLSDWTALIGSLYVLPGAILTLAIAAPWYLAENAATHGQFFQEFFLNQNLNRAMGVVDHKAGPWYYIPLLLAGGFPWSLFVIMLTPFCVRESWRRIKVSPAEMSDRARVTTFGATFLIFTFLFFSALPTKLATYLLPTFPALALLTGIALDQAARLRSVIGVRIATSLTVFVAAAAGAVLALSLHQPGLSLGTGRLATTIASFMQTTDATTRATGMCAMFLLALGGLLSLFLWGKRPGRAAQVLMLSTVAATAIAVPSGILLAHQEKCRDFQALLGELKTMNIDAVMLGRRSPSAMFYLHKRVQFLSGEEKIVDFAKEAPPRTCFLINQHAVAVLSDEGIEVDVLRKAGAWQIVRLK
jgi:4-amino-4-deoxy-L-arabinose transferase-like glycosyltransferase